MLCLIDLAELDSKEGTGLEIGVVVSWNAESGEIWGPSTASMAPPGECPYSRGVLLGKNSQLKLRAERRSQDWER